MTKTKARLIISQKLQDVLTERIQALYEQQLGQQLNEISYQAFDNTLVIVIEGAVTKPEKILNEGDCQVLARQVRTVLDRVIQSHLKGLIEEVMQARVVDFLSDTKMETDRTGAIAIFEFQAQQETNGSEPSELKEPVAKSGSRQSQANIKA